MFRSTSHPSATVTLQSPKPARHVRPQAPPVHVAADALAATGHGVVVRVSPSVLQTARDVPLHSAVPGVHVHDEQTPPLHVDIDGQVLLVNRRPSSLQVRAVRLSTHDEDPGTHRRSRQTRRERV